MYLAGTDIGARIELIDRLRAALNGRLRASAADYAAQYASMTAAEQREAIADMLTTRETVADIDGLLCGAKRTRDAVAKIDARDVSRKHSATHGPAKRTKTRARFHLSAEMREQLGIPEADRCECGKHELIDKLSADAVVAARARYTSVIGSYECPLCGRWHTTSKRPRRAKETR